MLQDWCKFTDTAADRFERIRSTRLFSVTRKEGHDVLRHELSCRLALLFLDGRGESVELLLSPGLAQVQCSDGTVQEDANRDDLGKDWIVLRPTRLPKKASRVHSRNVLASRSAAFCS